MNRIMNFMKWLFGSKTKVGITIILLVVAGYFGYKGLAQRTSQPQYQTVQAEKGNLITTVTASGNILSGNSVDITTTASGVVTEVFVQNGESVSQGQKIASIQLDQSSQAKLASAYSSYLLAKTALDAASAKINSLQSAAFKANQKLINDAVARGLVSNDPTYIQENADWLQAEADYKNQQAVISQAQASLNSAALNLSQISATITAPTSGTIANLILTPGLPITSPTSTTTSNIQKLGTISMEQGKLEASVNLSEIDAPKVRSGQKVTLTLDAFPGKTFTGKVGAVNTTGTVSSSVTTYPATIAFDTALANVYPNMAVSAKIIVSVKNDVVLVPSQAVQTMNGQATVRVMKNGNIAAVGVEIGDSNDTQTEINSGINEGDIIITGVSNAKGITQTNSSPFGGLGGRGFGGGFGGGGGVRRGD